MAASFALSFPRNLTDRRNDVTTIEIQQSAASLTPKEEVRKKPGIVALEVLAGAVKHRVEFSVPDSPTPAWLLPTIKCGGYLLALPAGWDQQGAPTIDSAYIQVALDSLYTFMSDRSSIPQWTPTQDGGVQLDWHENGIDLEIAFGPSSIDGYVVFADLEGRGPNWSGSVTDRLALLQQVFSQALIR
jgi:hypothetical protein